MAAETYTAGGVDPISRIRHEVPDIGDGDGTFDTNAAKYPDTSYYKWLEDALSPEALCIYLAEDNDAGATAATVLVSVIDSAVKLSLSRTIGGTPTASDVITLAPAAPQHRVRYLCDAIEALDEEWNVGLRTDDGEIIWLTLDSDGWVDDLARKDAHAIATLARAGDLALTRNGALSCLGSEDNHAALPFYCLDAALCDALNALKASVGPYSHRQEADVSWTKVSADAIDKAEQRAAFGIYSRV